MHLSLRKRMKPSTLRLFVSTLVAGSIGLAGFALAEGTVRVAIEADLPSLDPLVSTGGVPRYHGHMVYETLFGLDGNMQPQPVMVDEYIISEDGLLYTMTLRDGLSWHDGTPVTANDAIVSLNRWAARDRTFGVLLENRNAEFTAVDDATLTIALDEPLPILLEALAQATSPVPFIMPARIASTPPDTLITDATGSGPFIFQEEEWVPGAQFVYVRNPEYIPRSEPIDGFAGARIANFDRVEWLVIGDAQAASSALRSGEIDIWQAPNAELLPLLRAAPGIEITTLDPLGEQGLIRVNHLHPPFDDVNARRALMWLINQESFISAAVLDPSDGQPPCAALFVCGSPLATDIASEALMQHDPERARELFEAADWDFATPIHILHPTTHPQLNNATQVLGQALRDIGLTVVLEPMDWATLTERRRSQDLPGDGGWNLFMTSARGQAISRPTHVLHSTACEDAWFGWPCDEQYESYRVDYSTTLDLERRQEIASLMQERMYNEIQYQIPVGQWVVPMAIREEMVGYSPAPFTITMWNMRRGTE